MCIEASVENGKVVFDNTTTDLKSTKATRSVTNPQVWSVSGHTNLYSVVQWDNQKYGKVKDTNKLITEGNISNYLIRQIQHKLWNGEDQKPEELENGYLITDTKHVNTVIAKAYKNEAGQTVTVTDAEIQLTFLSESGWHQNAIGYYYYPSDEVPSSAADVKKYILFPNTSITGNAPYSNKKAGKDETYGYYDFGKDNAPLTTNTKIQLLYEDEEGKVSTKFPAGYTIGYFIMPKKYKSTDNNTESTYKLPDSYIYSNNAWNKGVKSHFISLSTQNGTVVYGIEDGGDSSYEDVLFTIDADPNEAIQDPDRPTIDPDPIITTTETTYRTYAYEDIWPTGGDYDLNDVIIEHKREITLNNKDNKNNVEKVVDTYTPVQPIGSATYADAFAVQYTQRGAIEIPTNAIDEKETNSVILFSDAKTVKDQDFVVTRTFEGSSMQKEDLKVDVLSLNPFIIAKYVEGQGNRTEVHMPKAKATSKANPEQLGKEDDAYYINKDGKHPFGIMVPVANDSETTVRFIPVTERTSIEKEYPDFEKWVESNGSSHNNWYLNYKGTNN